MITVRIEKAKITIERNREVVKSFEYAVVNGRVANIEVIADEGEALAKAEKDCFQVVMGMEVQRHKDYRPALRAPARFANNTQASAATWIVRK